MLERFVASLQALERRVFSLERRFRDFAAGSVRYLFQLLDVDITYDGSEAVVDGDVLTYDADLEKWVNAAPSDGSFASIRVDHDGSTTTQQWSLASAPELWMNAVTSGLGRGVNVAAAGVYQVNGWAWSDGTETRVMVFGPQIDTDVALCVSQAAVDEGVEHASASTLMAVPEGGFVSVAVTHNGSVAEWTLTMHLVHETDVEPGTCGG